MKRKMKNYLGRNLKKEREDDKMSEEKRSSLMSKVRSRDTKLERGFVTELTKRTRLNFKTNDRSIRGTPDIIFADKRVCVFLDSDFWHGWQYPRWKHLLKNDFWRRKIERNRRRDRLVTAYLKRHGWRVVRIWGHSIKKDGSGVLNRVLLELIKTSTPLNLKNAQP